MNDLVTKYHVYCPHETEHEIATLGERRFFSIPFWKLFVMMGYDWTSSTPTNYGFSFLNRGTSGKRMMEILDELGIAYTASVSNAGYCKQIRISRRKSNLERIAKHYQQFYTDICEKAKQLGLQLEENYFRSDEMITIHEWASEGKRITKL